MRVSAGASSSRAGSGATGVGSADLPSSGYLKLDHLNKAGAGKGGIGWHTRWFELRDDSLEYHASEADSRAKKTPLGLMEFEVDTGLRKGTRAMFMVVAGSRAMNHATSSSEQEIGMANCLTTL